MAKAAAKGSQPKEFTSEGFVGGGTDKERFAFEVTMDVVEGTIICSQQSLVEQVRGRLDDVLDQELGSDALWLRVKLLMYREKVE